MSALPMVVGKRRWKWRATVDRIEGPDSAGWKDSGHVFADSYDEARTHMEDELLRRNQYPIEFSIALDAATLTCVKPEPFKDMTKCIPFKFNIKRI